MTAKTPIHYRSLAETVRALAAGETTSEAVTAHMLSRIEAVDGGLHAYCALRPEAALAEARAADAARASGRLLGPLHGVPLAVKDLCALAGTETHAGGFFDTGFAPDATATCVARLQAAGAVILGKLQLTEGAWGAHHPDITAPLNPWSGAHWTGVSSSGSGVAVAAGLAFGAIGTDTAGSIRFPSAACGLVGLKPTWGRVSRHGVFPLCDTFDHVGPMTRTVVDAALMFEAMAGPDPLDATALNASAAGCVDAARRPSLAGLRIGLDRAYALEAVDPLTRAALSAAIETLREGGAEIVEISLPDVVSIIPQALLACFAEAAISHAATWPVQKDRYGPAYAELLTAGTAARAVDYAAAAIWRREFRGRLTQLFDEIDMIIAPVLPVSTPSLEMMAAATNAPSSGSVPLVGYTLPFNLAGVPTLTLPMAQTVAGVPQGFQLIGPDLSESTLLRAGAAFEAATRFSDRHPIL